MLYSLVGQHTKALEVRDQENNSFASQLVSNNQIVSAVDYIIEQARAHQIVMINEAHDLANHRALTFYLLQELWALGYRYIAFEALSDDIVSLESQGVLKEENGYYIREAIFANLVLKARQLGYQIVAYDQIKENHSGSLDERESNATIAIKEQIFDKQADAKVIFHVGYSHINEKKRWLASLLKTQLDINPFTVNQTELNEGQLDALLADKNISLESPPYVFLDSKNVPISLSPEKWDLSVYWPNTKLHNSRPLWAALGRMKKNADLKQCKGVFPCVVEVYAPPYLSEIPLDRVLIESEQLVTDIFINKGENKIVYSDVNGREMSVEKVVIE